MKYQVQIPQIHCSGCVNLIKMTLEEKFSNVEVDEFAKVAIFESDKDMNETKQTLDQTFKAELEPAGYIYNDLKIVNPED